VSRKKSGSEFQIIGPATVVDEKCTKHDDLRELVNQVREKMANKWKW